MESIEIKGFLSIDHAHLEIKKINILIGAQAQGKSVIAKLVYFFKRFFPEIFMRSIKRQSPKQEADKECEVQFKKIFPEYTWRDQEFSVCYQYDSYDVTIIKTKETHLAFNYSKELVAYQVAFQHAYESAYQQAELGVESLVNNDYLTTVDVVDDIYEKIIKAKIPNSLLSHSSIFIPAGRSFFATLQKNIFSFLSSDIEIDPLIEEFGARYQHAKRLNRQNFMNRLKVSEVICKKIENLVNNIVRGEYLYVDDQDWIVSQGKKTNLAHTSSGQQESLPMLLILKTFPLAFRQKIASTFFIEEPEAHLFPTAQKQIISLIATIYNSTGSSFFITTHSPYILTALNNLVVGQGAYDKAKANNNIEQLKKLAEVLPEDELIRLEDVAAYTLNNGKIESIIDLEDRLIGANLLDSVSDEFDIAFSVAIDALYGDT